MTVLFLLAIVRLLGLYIPYNAGIYILRVYMSNVYHTMTLYNYVFPKLFS